MLVAKLHSFLLKISIRRNEQTEKGIFPINLKLLKLAEHIDLNIQNYQVTDKLGKQSLHEYCVKSQTLNQYIPEGSSFTSIGCEFYISVYVYFI